MAKLRIYLARSMSGRIAAEVVEEAKKDKEYLESWGIEVLCPVHAEQVKPTKQPILSSKKAMDEYWFRDKKMIEEAHVLFDMSPQMKSEGVAHELGYARYFLYKPVIRVYKDGQLPPPSSVSFYEDDYLATSLCDACSYTQYYYGTWIKRFVWRLRLYNRCLFKMICCWFGGWK